MTRSQRIAQLNSAAEKLSDAQINALFDLSVAMTRPSVYGNLPAEQRASIDLGIADYEAGRVVDAEEVFSEIDKRLTSTGA